MRGSFGAISFSLAGKCQSDAVWSLIKRILDSQVSIVSIYSSVRTGRGENVCRSNEGNGGAVSKVVSFIDGVALEYTRRFIILNDCTSHYVRVMEDQEK